MRFFLVATLAAVATTVSGEFLQKKKHHKKHHKHHKKVAQEPKEKKEEKKKGGDVADKIKEMSEEVEKTNATEATMTTATVTVNGPLPADFNALLKQEEGKALGVPPADAPKVIEVHAKPGGKLVDVVIEGKAGDVHNLQAQAADPNSPLASGIMEPFLVANEGVEDVSVPPGEKTGHDVDAEMPFGELEPFGRENTAKELTDDSIHESDAMVDQMERAEVAEEKRSVFRALTRLRGAAITSFDGVARTQTGNIDEYNKSHKWRGTHPLHHLAGEEADTAKWAFPDQ